MRLRVIITVFILCVLWACTKSAPLTPVNVTPEGVAIKGYDPVAYFIEKKPVMGAAGFEYSWQGARWQFSTAANLEDFRRAPEKYAPQYGGYCAYAVSQGKIADIDPDAWTVLDGKLYLNLNKDVQALWEKDMQSYIRKADENWPGMLGKR